MPYRWWMVAALSVTTTAGYGILAYAFAVFLVPLQDSLGASRTAITFAPAVSLLTSAAVAVPAGRWLDRHGGRALMVASSVLATACLLAWSRVENVLQLYAVSVGLGVAAAGVLYESAFAVVVTWFRGRRRGTAMLAITIVGGFASTIFLPLTGLLVEWYGWRTALVLLGILYGGLTIPLHLVVRRPAYLRAPHPDGSPPATGEEGDEAEGARAGTARPDPVAERARAVRGAFAAPGYWLIAAAFVAEGVGIFVISVHLVAYLGELGHAATLAATVAGLLGVLSVTGRVATTAAQRRFPLTSVLVCVFVLQAAGLFLLPWMGAALAGAIGCVLAIGLGFGVGTIARPALIAERYGVAGYATLAGLQAAFLMVTKAFAPLGAAWLRTASHSYTPVMLVCGVVSLVGAAGFLAVGRLPAR